MVFWIRLAVIALACLPAQWALACSCMVDRNLSDRWYFAQNEAVAEIRIVSAKTVEVVAQAPVGSRQRTRQQVVAEVRQVWMDRSLWGIRLTFEHFTDSMSTCSSPGLFKGATWITGIGDGRIPEGNFSFCGLAKHRSVDPAKATRFARLEREFMQRRRMDDEGWEQLLAPLRERAEFWAGVAAQSCMQRMDSDALPGSCPGGIARKYESFWAVSEDPMSDVPVFYAFARAPMGALRMWSAPMVQAPDALLTLDLSELREQHCDWFALAADSYDRVCRTNR